jgi:hypothetical protein
VSLVERILDLVREIQSDVRIKREYECDAGLRLNLQLDVRAVSMRFGLDALKYWRVSAHEMYFAPPTTR